MTDAEWLDKYDRAPYWLTRDRYARLLERVPKGRWPAGARLSEFDPFDAEPTAAMFLFRMDSQSYAYRSIDAYRYGRVVGPIQMFTPLNMDDLLFPPKVREMEF